MTQIYYLENTEIKEMLIYVLTIWDVISLGRYNFYSVYRKLPGKTDQNLKIYFSFAKCYVWNYIN